MNIDNLIAESERALFQLIRDLDVFRYLLNPVNLAEERDKFLSKFDAGIVYNPKYEYRRIPNTTLGLLKKAKQLLPKLASEMAALHGNRLAELLEQVIVEEIAYLRLYGVHRGSEFHRLLTDLFKYPDDTTLIEARRILTESPPVGKDDSGEILPDVFVARVKRALAEKSIDWTMRKDGGLGARFSTNSVRREITIRADDSYTEYDFTRFIVHELQTHIYRSENGYAQPYAMFAMGLKGYLKTEEGLAAYVEEQNGVLTYDTLRMYAGRAVAASMAEESFYEIFQEMTSYFTPDLAYQITHRIKRGCEDTSLPGGFTKDYIYLAGKLMVGDYIAAGEDVEDLFVGKVAIEQMPIVRELINVGQIQKPRLLPKL